MPSYTISMTNEEWIVAKPLMLLAAPNQLADQDPPVSNNDWIKKKLDLIINNWIGRGAQMQADAAAVEPEYPKFTIE